MSSISYELVSPLDPAPANSESLSTGEGKKEWVDQSWPFSREVDAALEEVRKKITSYNLMLKIAAGTLRVPIIIANKMKNGVANFFSQILAQT